MSKEIHIALFEPEIPQNTGNIARTAVALNVTLHLIEPFGFSLDDRYLKRAGLDYWSQLKLETHQNLDSFLNSVTVPLYLFSTKGERIYTEVEYPSCCCLLFGKESAGLPSFLLEKYRERTLRIPTTEDTRSLNLSNTAAIALYEVERQRDFDGLKKRASGHLSKGAVKP